MNNSNPPPSPEWLPFVNTTAEVIPGGAVLEPAGGYDAKGRIRVRKCTADDSYLVFFNGPMSVDAASLGGAPDDEQPGGLCRAPWPLAAAAVHATDLTGYTYPTNAGAKAGDWYMRLSRTGFKFIDPLADGTATVVPVPAANPVADRTPVTKTEVTNVCVVRDTYGVLTGIRVEYTPRTYGPTGVTDGTPYCVTNPTACVCPVIGPTCPGCGGPPTVVNPALVFNARTGAAACLPDSVALAPREYQNGVSMTPVDAVNSTFEVLPVYPFWSFCNGAYSVVILVDVLCRADGPSGYLIRAQIVWYIGGSYNLGTSPLSDGWLAPGAGNVSAQYTFEVPAACAVFDSAGSVLLGTITDPADFVSSVEVWFSWQ